LQIAPYEAVRLLNISSTDVTATTVIPSGAKDLLFVAQPFLAVLWRQSTLIGGLELVKI